MAFFTNVVDLQAALNALRISPSHIYLLVIYRQTRITLRNDF